MFRLIYFFSQGIYSVFIFYEVIVIGFFSIQFWVYFGRYGYFYFLYQFLEVRVSGEVVFVQGFILRVVCGVGWLVGGGVIFFYDLDFVIVCYFFLCYIYIFVKLYFLD